MEKNNILKEFLLKDLDRLIEQDKVLTQFLNIAKTSELLTAPKETRVRFGGALMRQLAIDIEFLYICSLLEGGLELNLDDALNEPQKERLVKAKLGTSSLPFISSSGKVTFHESIEQFLSQLENKN